MVVPTFSIPYLGMLNCLIGKGKKQKGELLSPPNCNKLTIFLCKQDITKKSMFSREKQIYKKMITTNLVFWLMIIFQNLVDHTEQNINVFYRIFLKTLYHYMIIY